MTSNRNICIVLTFVSIFFSINVIAQFNLQYNNGTLAKDTSSRGDISFLYNQIKFDTVLLVNKSDYVKKLKQLEIISGTTYFSGTGFPQVSSAVYKGRLKGFSSFFERCVPGSKITFEKCTFKNDDGTISGILNKSIYFK